MIPELCEYIKPKIVKNVDSGLYKGDPLFKERKIIKDLVKDFASGKHKKIRPYLRKNIDIPGPMPLHDTTTRARTSSSSSSSNSPRLIMLDQLIVPSPSSDSEEVSSLIHTFHYSDSEEDDEEIASVFLHTYNNGRVQSDSRAGIFYMKFLGRK